MVTPQTSFHLILPRFREQTRATRQRVEARAGLGNISRFRTRMETLLARLVLVVGEQTEATHGYEGKSVIRAQSVDNGVVRFESIPGVA